jgi:hypothetical protein
MIPADFLIHRYMKSAKGKTGERKLISLWLKMLNMTGMVGLTGILITGVWLVFILPYYGFFRMTDNHWLAAKQIDTVIIMILTGVYFIPLGKKIRLSLGNEEETSGLTDESYANIKKLSNIAIITSVLLALNYLFAITRTMM